MIWILLGICQGVTEFLPVSSSGHLAVAQSLSGFLNQLPNAQLLFFDVWLHVATLAAIVIYYRKTLIQILVSLPAQIRALPQHRLRKQMDCAALRIVALGIVATIPTGLIGLAAKGWVEEIMRSNGAVAVAWTVNGLLLFLAGRMGLGKKSDENATFANKSDDLLSGLDLSFPGALLLGVAQGLAITPGISRSGITISVLFFLGVSGQRAGFFSFFIAIPAILGATVLTFGDLGGAEALPYLPLGLGFLSAFLSGYLALILLMKTLRSGWFPNFAYYCWAIAAITFLTLL